MFEVIGQENNTELHGRILQQFESRNHPKINLGLNQIISIITYIHVPEILLELYKFS